MTLPKVERDDVDGLHLGGKKILTRWANEQHEAVQLAWSVNPYLRRKVERIVLDEYAPL